MELLNFDNLYSYKEKKNRSYLEDFFSELTLLMTELSPYFKKQFIYFLIKNEESNSDYIILTQESKTSANQNKKLDRPDIIIYKSGEDYSNDSPILLCESKIDANIDQEQIKSYLTTFKNCIFCLITTKRNIYNLPIKKYKHLFWEDFYLQLKNLKLKILLKKRS